MANKLWEKCNKVEKREIWKMYDSRLKWGRDIFSGCDKANSQGRYTVKIRAKRK